MDRQELILENLNLAYSIASKYQSHYRKYFDIDDAKQICVEGLIRAADTFNKEQGNQFSTYAYVVIKNQLAVSIRAEVRRLGGKTIVSIDQALTEEDEDFSLLSLLSDDFDLESSVVENNEIKQLHKYINELAEPYKTIMNLRCKSKTHEQIAEITHSNKAVVQKNYQRALNMLRYKYIRGGRTDG